MSFLEIRAPFNKRKVESAEDLWAQFMDYVEHSETTPLVEPKIFCGKEGPQHGDLAKPRPLTLNAFCNYLGIHPGTWGTWKSREKKAAENDVNHCVFFLDVLLQIESIIYDHQFQGATVNIFNASIVSRKLGLAETRDYVSSDNSMSPQTEIDVSRLTLDEKKQLLALHRKARQECPDAPEES